MGTADGMLGWPVVTRLGLCALLLLMVAGCQEAVSWRIEAASAIGDQLAPRIGEPLARAATARRIREPDPIERAVEVALDEISLPPDVYRLVLGSHMSVHVSGGRAAVSFPLVVVPIGETEHMFCMVFAMSTTGELIAKPASGSPIDRCADTDTVGLVTDRQRG